MGYDMMYAMSLYIHGLTNWQWHYSWRFDDDPETHREGAAEQEHLSVSSRLINKTFENVVRYYRMFMLILKSGKKIQQLKHKKTNHTTITSFFTNSLNTWHHFYPAKPQEPLRKATSQTHNKHTEK